MVSKIHKINIKKIISSIIIFVYVPVSTLWGLDFAWAKDEKSPTKKSSIKSTTESPSNSSDSYPSLSPEQAAQRRSLAGEEGEIRVPITFNSLKSFQTDPFTGAATFTVPIAVPPGRGGIQPNIALSYSSSSSNSICGQGWNLELGAIERSTKKGVPSYTDSDTYVFISGGSTVELVDIGGKHYRAKIESAFMDFYFNDSYWEVRDKAGTKYWLGQSSSSRIEGAPGIFRWAIDKVSDINSNYMRISYLKDNNQLYPESIQYTAFGNDDNFLHGNVEFIYETRNDIFSNYRPKFLVKTTQRLVDIIIKAADNSRIRKYHINYTNSPATARSLISNVTQFSNDDSQSLPPLTLNYQQPNSGWTQTNSWNIPHNPADQHMGAEFASWVGFPRDQGVRIIDINNDGYPDLLKYAEESRQIQKTFMHNQADGWYESTSASWPDPITLCSGETRYVYFNSMAAELNKGGGLRLADVNGDGWTDLLFHYKSRNGCDTKKTWINDKNGGWVDDSSWYMPEGSAIIWEHEIGCPYDCFEIRTFLGVVFSDVNG
ncbi:MAG: SpvB/TcaC N-terminal domain-containing protein, partial [Candidatus Omnitrophota bacterium]